MPIKLDIGDAKSKKTFHAEAEIDNFVGKKLGEKISGEEIDAKFAGFEFEITGASDKAGFPAKKDVEGVGLKRVMLKKGFCLRKLKKKKKTSKARPKIRKGFRKRRVVRGNTISSDIVQINLKILKEGKKSIASVLGKEEAKAEKPAEQASEAKEAKPEIQAEAEEE